VLLQNCEVSACVSHFTFAYSPRMLSYGVRRIGWWSAGGSDMALTRGHTMRGTFLFVGLLIALTVTHEAAAQDRSNQPFIVSQYTPTPSPSQPKLKCAKRWRPYARCADASASIFLSNTTGKLPSAVCYRCGVWFGVLLHAGQRPNNGHIDDSAIDNKVGHVPTRC